MLHTLHADRLQLHMHAVACANSLAVARGGQVLRINPIYSSALLKSLLSVYCKCVSAARISSTASGANLSSCDHGLGESPCLISENTIHTVLTEGNMPGMVASSLSSVRNTAAAASPSGPAAQHGHNHLMDASYDSMYGISSNVANDPHTTPPPVSFLSTSCFSNMGDTSLAGSVAVAGDEYAFYRSWLKDQVDKDPELAAQWAQWEAQGLTSPRGLNKQLTAPWSQAASTASTMIPTGGAGSSSTSSSCTAAAQILQQQVPVLHHHHHHHHHRGADSHKRAETDLREHIAKHLAAHQDHVPETQTETAAAAGSGSAMQKHSEPAHQHSPVLLRVTSKGSSRGSFDGYSPRPLASRGANAGSSGHRVATSIDLSRTQLKAVRKLFPIMQPSLKPAAALQGEYQLLDIIGRGAFGCAYKARHLPTGRLMCIKTLEAPAGQNREEELKRQKREVAVLAALALHPNIIRYHECFADGSKLQLVMEWADGGDLDSLIQRHVKARTYMSEDQVLGYFVQLIAALAHIHALGIMHRDIKTNNIFLTTQGLLKVGDFGISKVLDAPATTSNSGSGGKGGSAGTSSSGISVHPSRGVLAHSFVGTPNYLAPEMVTCEGYGFKADIWAAGCVLYEMAALKPAFRAKHISVIYHLIRRGKTSSLPGVFSKELQALQRRMMAQDPCQRPSCAELMQEDLLRPHFERYHTLLRQLKLELPRMPTDLSHGSTSGALRTASLLTGGLPRDHKCDSGTLSNRSSMEDWGWNRPAHKKGSRDSAEYKAFVAGTQPDAPLQAQQPPQLQPTLAAQDRAQQKQQQQQQRQQQHKQQFPATLAQQLQQQQQQVQQQQQTCIQDTLQQQSTPPSTGSSTPQVLTAPSSLRTTQEALGAPHCSSAARGGGSSSSKHSSCNDINVGCPAAGPFLPSGPATPLLSPLEGKGCCSSSGASSNNGCGLASLGSGVIADVSCAGSSAESSDWSTPTAASAGTKSHKKPKPAPLHIEVLPETPPHNSIENVLTSYDAVVTTDSSSSSAPHSTDLEGGSAGSSGSFLHASGAAGRCVNGAAPLNAYAAWTHEQQQQQQQEQQQHQQQVLVVQHQQQQQQEGQQLWGQAPRPRKCLLRKLHTSLTALWGGSSGSSGSRQLSRLGIKSLQASASADKLKSSRKRHKSKRKASIVTDGSSSGSGSEGQDGTIPAVQAGGLVGSAPVAQQTQRSWSDLLREAGITAGTDPADVQLLAEAGALWQASCSNSQRSSLEQGSPLRSAGGGTSISCRSSWEKPGSGAGGLQGQAPAAGKGVGSLDLALPTASSKHGSMASLSSWFASRISTEQQQQQQPTAAAAVSSSLPQQQPQLQPVSHMPDIQAALPVPQSATGSLLMPHQLHQLRQLAAVFGSNGPGVFSSLSTITECSEGASVWASRRGSETTVHSPNVQSIRGSLDVKSPKAAEAASKPASPLSSPWRTAAAGHADVHLSTVPESNDAEGAQTEGASALGAGDLEPGSSTAVAPAADSSSVLDNAEALQREQLALLGIFHKLQAVLKSPLPQGDVASYMMHGL